VNDASAARNDPDARASLWEPPELGQKKAATERHLPTAAEIQAIEEEARQNGFESGYSEGHELGRDEAEKEARARADKELREAVASLEGAAAGLADPLAQGLDALEPELLALVTAMARKVIRSELEARPDRIREILHAALGQLPGRNQEVQVHLNPEDQALVADYGENADPRIRWIPDPALARGGCRVEAGAATVDASLEKRLQQALEALWNGDYPAAEEADADNAQPLLKSDPGAEGA